LHYLASEAKRPSFGHSGKKKKQQQQQKKQ